ncbi:hypothetical protein PSAB6_460116 [Paraburkholderia sabiae]|nr:hypothetical protein PSAB6_460116 [Paraburkholderia sabiae]
MIRTAYQRIAGTPHGEREECNGRQQREKRADDPSMNAEVCARRHRVIRAVAHAEQAHRRKNARADQHADHDRRDARPERQAEQHGKTAEHGSRKRIAAAEQQAEQIDGPRIAGLVGDALETEGLDGGDAAVVALVTAAHVSDSSDGQGNHTARHRFPASAFLTNVWTPL